MNNRTTSIRTLSILLLLAFASSAVAAADVAIGTAADIAGKCYAVGDTVTITGVTAGDVLVVDGIEGRILQNGAPCAGNMSFLHLPALVPGENVFSCPEVLTVEYYPTYI